MVDSIHNTTCHVEKEERDREGEKREGRALIRGIAIVVWLSVVVGLRTRLEGMREHGTKTQYSVLTKTDSREDKF